MITCQYSTSLAAGTYSQTLSLSIYYNGVLKDTRSCETAQNIQKQPPELQLGKKKRPATLLIKRLWHRCFPVNFAKFLRTCSLQNTSGRLLLNVLYVYRLHLTQLKVLIIKICIYVNPLQYGVAFLYPLKTSESPQVF